MIFHTLTAQRLKIVAGLADTNIHKLTIVLLALY